MKTIAARQPAAERERRYDRVWEFVIFATVLPAMLYEVLSLGVFPGV